MGALIGQNPGIILDHYADVIEGGNAYASGTSYYGIPGQYPSDAELRSSALIIADAAGGTTTIAYSSGDWEESRWVKERSPGYFLYCYSGAAKAVGKARRITGWNNTTKVFTVDAFPAAPGDGAWMLASKGFKRLPDGVDVFSEDTEVAGGYDRYFDLDLIPGARLDWHGSGRSTYEGELVLRLRLLKYGRARETRQSALNNITILADAMTSSESGQEHRDGTYVRTLYPPDGPPDIEEDKNKLVASLPLRITYRVERGL